MKIVLISTSIEDVHRSDTIQENSHYPIGVAYLVSCLKQKQHIVDTLFLNDYSYDQSLKIIENKIETFKPDTIGFNILTPNRVSSFQAIHFIHTKYPDIKIVVGGIHVTLLYEQILDSYEYVIAVLGEGELTFLELLEKFSDNDTIRSVKGIAFKQNGNLVKTESRPLIEDLDSLPFPEHKSFFTPNRTTACLLTSRGCPFKCSFCVLDSISRQKVRYRSVSNVVDEIEYLDINFPQLSTIWIHDDNFLLSNRRAIEICNEIVNRGIKKKFICSARFKPFSVKLLKALETAGFVEILFGLESGSKKVLELCHKKIKQEDVVETISIFKNSTIKPICFLIVGLYGEDDSTIKETIHFVKKLQKIKYIYFDDIGIAMAYPGTELYEIAQKNDQIDDSYWLTDKPTPIFTAEHSQEKLLSYHTKIRNHISFKRMFTFSGFFIQLAMLPHSAPYVSRKIFQRIRRKTNMF